MPEIQETPILLTIDGVEDELSQRALSLYRETLQATLEPEQSGRGLAIHPDGGEYLVADTPTEAGNSCTDAILKAGPSPCGSD